MNIVNYSYNNYLNLSKKLLLTFKINIHYFIE